MLSETTRFAQNLKKIDDWMINAALPLWGGLGMDKAYGGPLEDLTLDYLPNDPGFKRVRVPARQLYVFSHAITMGQDYAAHALSCRDFLLEHCFMDDVRGFARRVFANGTIKDDTADLYDNAFVLFGLCWHAHATGDQTSLSWARKLLGLITDNYAHPSNIGFYHQLPKFAGDDIGPRQQNPHMHFLEACLAMSELLPDNGAEPIAEKLVGLFQSHFYDAKDGTLGEFFDDNFIRLQTDKGLIVEPGHQFEWAWILAQAEKIIGTKSHDAQLALIAYAQKFGISPRGLTYNSLYRDGQILDGGSRTWPNTERLKAASAHHAITGIDPRPEMNAAIEILFDQYLDVEPFGGWMDARDKDGKAAATAIPTSTLYHIWVAFDDVRKWAKRHQAL